MNGDWFERIAHHPLLLPPAVRRDNGSENVLKLLGELRRRERLPPADLVQEQREMLLVLARHSVRHSPHFAARLDDAGLTPDTLAEEGGLAKLPPLTRQELVQAGDALFCKVSPASHGGIAPTTTSGSTGEPVTIRKTGICQLHWMAATLRDHLWHQRDFAGRLAVLRANIPEPIEAPDWGPPCSLLFRTGAASAMPPTPSVEELCQWLTRFDPHYLLILPSTLAGILTALEQNAPAPQPLALSPQPSPFPRLRDIRTLSETVHPALREAAQRVLGVPIHDSYTSQEGGIMATQCPEHGSYHVSETILLEVLDATDQPCRDGEIGRVVITDLVNFATPLIRYEIGDYAEAGAPCPCGRSLPAIRRFLGRERNLVLLPDGTRHWPTVGYHRYAEVHPIRQFQFIQLDRHTLLARLSAPGRPDPTSEARLTAIIQEALGHPFAIRYEWHESPLPRPPGSKFEEFICRAE